MVSAMKPSLALAAHRDAIVALVASHKAANPRVFGSVLHGVDQEGSDLDLLVDALPETTLFDLGRLHGRLEALLGISVDLLTPEDLPPKLRSIVVAEARAL